MVAKARNSCKGKGGCATDGSKMPEESHPLSQNLETNDSGLLGGW